MRFSSGIGTLAAAAMASALSACGHAPPVQAPAASAPNETASLQSAGQPEQPLGADLVGAEVAAIHQGFFALDTHLDTPAFLVSLRGYDVMKRHRYFREGTQVDVPRMNEGGLDGGFWVIFTPQGALNEASYQSVRDIALQRSLAIHKMVAANPETFELATTAEDAIRINAEGKKVVFQSIENSYPIGEDLSLIGTFYKLGVRMIGPVHSRNNQFADSSTDEPQWNGLSPLGKELVAEANRLGMVVDGSHASDQALEDMIELSATPVILSHSGTNAIYDHPRNVPDELLVKLAEKGGVIQMNALGRYLADVSDPSPERVAALQALGEKWPEPNALSEADYQTYLDEREALNRNFPPPNATFENVMEQTLHALELLGPDHVGMGSDWDGGGGVIGFQDISYLPKVTASLLEAGYSPEDIEKIWSGNLLRVVKAAADYAASQ